MRLPDIICERLLLRSCIAADVDPLHNLWTAPEVRRWLWDDLVIPRETVEDVVHQHLLATQQGIGLWAVHVLAKGWPDESSVDGFCGFRFVDGGSEIELLFGLRGEYWGQGLAAEACRAALDYLWSATEFAQVWASVDAGNERSVRLLERLGMARRGEVDGRLLFGMERPAS